MESFSLKNGFVHKLATELSETELKIGFAHVSHVTLADFGHIQVYT